MLRVAAVVAVLIALANAQTVTFVVRPARSGASPCSRWPDEQLLPHKPHRQVPPVPGLRLHRCLSPRVSRHRDGAGIDAHLGQHE